MRILQFCNYADRIGGAEVYAHALVEALRARGHAVALFGGSPEREVDTTDLRVIQRPQYDPLRLVRDTPALNALKELVERFRPAIVHVHNLFSVALEVVDHLGRCGVPLVQTVHDYQLLCPNSWCVRGDGSACPGGPGAQCFQHDCQQNYPYDSWGVLLSALRLRLARAAAVLAIAPSSHLVARLREHGWARVHQLPYFIDGLPHAAGVARAEYELLYVGRLEREKGVDVLLSAMPAILDAVPRARLTLVGSGSQEHALKRQAAKANLAPAVRFSTQVPRHELPALYARAAACVLPSIWTENSPLVAYECLLFGLPMLGSRLGGIPELIEPACGYTFTPRDPDDLARTAIRFLRLPLAERQRMSTSARERSLSHDRGAHITRIEELYGDALAVGSVQGQSSADFSELAPILHQIGVDRLGPPPSGPRSRPLEVLRNLARELGLPKVLKG